MQATAQYLLFSEKPIADVPTLVANLATFGYPANGPLVWAFLQDNWDDIITQQKAKGCEPALISLRILL